ncbi:MAG: Hsp20/alpha crystallin family protein [Anaerolineae bacterium]|jgi:HSP20 family protein
MSNLVRWEPFRELMSLREAMDRLFEESVVRPGRLALVRAEALAVDMYETDDALIVKSAVPGVRPEDLDITISGDTLTIKGETKAEEEVREEDYVRRELRYGSFSRSLSLPLPIVADEAQAEFKEGILTLTLPKAEEIRPRSIKVKAK